MELNDCIVSHVLPEQRGLSKRSGTEWVKRTFVVEWDINGYKRHLCLEVMGDGIWDKIKDGVLVGNRVSVRFDVCSSEWQGRWFTTATCFGLSVVGQSQVTQQPQSQSQQPKSSAVSNGVALSDGGVGVVSSGSARDLPF